MPSYTVFQCGGRKSNIQSFLFFQKIETLKVISLNTQLLSMTAIIFHNVQFNYIIFNVKHRFYLSQMWFSLKINKYPLQIKL